MSVTFEAENLPGHSLNLANSNARSFLVWLGLPESDDLCGDASVLDVAALCRRRLWPEPRNADPGIPASESGGVTTCRVIHAGRAPGYHNDRARTLLLICEGAKTGNLRWF